MYEGSMIGAGATAFAIMGYAISRQQPPDFNVELNSKLLSAILGEPEDEVIKAIEYLCSPDPNSRSEKNDGRRMIKVGSFTYHMVNGEDYHRLRNYEERKDYNRKKQAEYREKRRLAGAPQSEETPTTQPPKEHPSTRFIKPTLSDLISAGLDDHNAQRFLDHYDSVGWKINRNPMKDWRAAARNWMSRSKEWSGNGNGAAPSKPSREMTDAEILREACQ